MFKPGQDLFLYKSMLVFSYLELVLHFQFQKLDLEKQGCHLRCSHWLNFETCSSHHRHLGIKRFYICQIQSKSNKHLKVQFMMAHAMAKVRFEKICFCNLTSVVTVL